MCPLCGVWERPHHLSEGLGPSNSNAQQARVEGTLDRHHQTPEAQLK